MMRSQYTILAYWSWLLLGLVWLPGYFMSKNTSNVPRRALQIPATLLLIAGFTLLLNPGFQVPDMPVTPNNALFGIVGVMLDLPGVALAVWARLALGRNWSGIVVTMKQGHELVQTGPYAVVRHPIYTGLLLAVIGTAATEGTFAAYVGVAAIFIAFLIRVAIEEQLMSEQFGEAYQAYRGRTWKLVPLVW
jgi:protein-S-isoprenylcysteine O-methyltransferase Ste14